MLLIAAWATAALYFAMYRNFFALPMRPPSLRPLPLPAVTGAFLIFLGMQLLFPSLILLTMGKQVLATPYARGWFTLAIFLFIPTLLFGYFTAFCSPWRKQIVGTAARRWREIGLGILCWLFCYPFIALIAFFFDLLFVWLGLPLPKEQLVVMNLREIAPYPLLFWLTALSIVFLSPLVEELLFRGFLQSWLRSYLAPYPAIVLSSLVFTTFHFSEELGLSNLQFLSALFFLSCFLGFLRERQDSLFAAIALHATFNGMSVLALLAGF